MDKLNVVVEKTKLNPKANWIELEVKGDTLLINVSNFDYCLSSSISVTNDEKCELHATVTADTFIPLISKLDEDVVSMSDTGNALVVDTSYSSYTFPIIKEMGKVKRLDTIQFENDGIDAVYDGKDISTISTVNSKGLTNSIYVTTNDGVQQYVYFDNLGAITFTENIYINHFVPKVNYNDFRVLLNATQSKILKIFSKYEDVSVTVYKPVQYEDTSKIKFQSTSGESSICLVMVTQSEQLLDKFPALRLRGISDSVRNTKATINKKELEKSLNRLMVFDKKFDISVLNYSKLVFDVDSVKLVSIKNRNYEIIKYTNSENTIKHESMIRFADLVAQLKALTDKEITINYGESPAIVIDSGNVKQLIPEVQMVSGAV